MIRRSASFCEKFFCSFCEHLCNCFGVPRLGIDRTALDSHITDYINAISWPLNVEILTVHVKSVSLLYNPGEERCAPGSYAQDQISDLDLFIHRLTGVIRPFVISKAMEDYSRSPTQNFGTVSFSWTQFIQRRSRRPATADEDTAS